MEGECTACERKKDRALRLLKHITAHATGLEESDAGRNRRRMWMCMACKRKEERA